MINVLVLSKDKIDFLLTNHKYFTSAEIVLAAKIKVVDDKKPNMYRNDSYLACLQGLERYQGQAQYNPYLGGRVDRGVFGGVF